MIKKEGGAQLKDETGIFCGPTGNFSGKGEFLSMRINVYNFFNNILN